MGYQTQYKISSDDGRDDEHIAGVLAETGYSASFIEEGCKWYDHERDMRAYFRLHPTVTFTLDGDGEDAGDVWRKWFRNGDMRQWCADATRPDSPSEKFKDQP